MAEEQKTELEKSLRALLLVNLEPLKQKQQITILDKAGLVNRRSRRSSGLRRKL